MNKKKIKGVREQRSAEHVEELLGAKYCSKLNNATQRVVPSYFYETTKTSGHKAEKLNVFLRG